MRGKSSLKSPENAERIVQVAVPESTEVYVQGEYIPILEYATSGTTRWQKFRRRGTESCHCRCYHYFLSVLLILILGSLLYLIVNPKQPQVEVEHTKLQAVHAYTEKSSKQIFPRVKLDIELLLNVLIINPNIIGFRYRHVSALIGYRGERIGQVDTFTGGKVRSYSQKLVAANLNLKGVEILQNGAAMIADVARGQLAIELNSTVQGSTGVLFWDWPFEVATTCSLLMDPAKSLVLEQECSTSVGL